MTFHGAKKISGQGLMLVAVSFALTLSALAQSPLKIEGMIIETNAKIIPDADFNTKIKAAIDLLKAKAPEDLEVMKSVIGKIRAYPASGANFNEAIMTIDIGKLTFDASLEWLASVLIHETKHIKLFKDTGKRYGNASLMTDKKAALQLMINEELTCNAAQLVVLGKVGGKKYEIEYLKSQKGDHFDIDKDGDYDMDDYKARKW